MPGELFVGGVPECPEIVVAAVVDQAAGHLSRSGRSTLDESLPSHVKAILNDILAHQGVKLTGFRNQVENSYGAIEVLGMC